MPFYRLAARGFWLDMDPSTGEVRSLPRKPVDATSFDTESSARTALDLAKRRVEEQFAGLFPAGKAPAMSVATFCGFSPASKGPQPALTLAILATQLADCAPEEFEPPPSPGSPIVLPKLYVIVSDKGCFAREGTTGYMSFTDELQEASYFTSALDAKNYLEACEPRAHDVASIEHARILELNISPNASLDPKTLEASDNAATALMRTSPEPATEPGMPCEARPPS